METADVTLCLRKNGIRYKRKASGLRYVKADDQSCLLYFINGETFSYGYRLKILLTKIYCLTFLIKVHRSYIININEAANYSYRKSPKVKLSNGTELPLNDYGYEVVKEFVDKKHSIPPSSAA